MATVLITGSSRGIGKECALRFAKAGYNVAVNYVKSDKEAKEVVEEIRSMGVSCEAFKADVSDSKKAKELCCGVIDKFGKIEMLVNNAGIAQQKLFTDITDDEWKRMIDTNLSSVFYLSREVAKDMIHYKNGCIINIASMWGEVGASCETHYSAAKAGVIGLTKAMAKELSLSNIRVNCISPGVIDTDMCKDFDDETMELLRNDIPLKRIGTAEDVAKVALYLAESANYVTGQVISVNGGYII